MISSNYSTIQALRSRVQELEKHKYVLGYKAEKYQERLQPTVDQIENLTDRLNSQDQGIVEDLCRSGNLRRRILDKDDMIRYVLKETIG